MPKEHEHKYLTYSLRIYVRFLGQFFFLRFPRERWEKKIVVPCLDVIIMIAFFPRNIQ